jgi:GNAT superfamily N-acetyltransferase
MGSDSPPGKIIDQIIHTTASDGKAICIRSIRNSDAEQMRAGIAQLSTQSRYLRFFSVQPMPSDTVIERLVDADGHEHIAWGAIHMDGADNPAIGAVHAIRSEERDGIGEFSVAIIDDYQGIGIGRMLTAVLLINCQIEGMEMLDIQTLAENQAAIGFIRSIGGELRQWDSGVQDYVLAVKPALDAIRQTSDLQGMKDIFEVFGRYL